MGTHSKLNQRLVRSSTNPLDGKHDIVLRSARIKSTPNTATKKDKQTQNVNNLSTELHCRGDPDDIEESKK
jgi:hypothetical protein